MILNVADVTCVGAVVVLAVASVTFFRVTHFVRRSRWKTTYLPAKDCAAVTETLNLPRASYFSVRTGATFTATDGLVEPFSFAW